MCANFSECPHRIHRMTQKFFVIIRFPIYQYSTLARVRPLAGAVWPAARRFFALNIAGISVDFSFPLPTSMMVPIIFRTMYLKKLFPAMEKVISSPLTRMVNSDISRILFLSGSSEVKELKFFSPIKYGRHFLICLTFNG